MSLILKCPKCGKEFSSIMLYDEHLKKNSNADFLELFNKLLIREMAVRNQPTLQVVIDNFVAPELAKLGRKRKTKTKTQRRRNPKLSRHKKVDRRKRK